MRARASRYRAARAARATRPAEALRCGVKGHIAAILELELDSTMAVNTVLRNSKQFLKLLTEGRGFDRAMRSVSVTEP